MTNDPRDLVFTREIGAPREAVWRCWTEAALMTRWFTPAPWRTVHAEVDLRPGGACNVTMMSPDGQEVPNRGVYLEVSPPERLVFTDAFTVGWLPAEKPFMTGVLTFEDAGGGRTRYTALIRHWTMEDRAAHEGMGFFEGWGKATDQLEETARSV